MSTEHEVLLLPLFQTLRRAGIPLGLSEYLLAIESIREGLGLENVNTFQRICRLLWAKSREDQVIFDRAFEELVTPRLEFVPPTSLHLDVQESLLSTELHEFVSDHKISSTEAEVIGAATEAEDDNIACNVSLPFSAHVPSPIIERRFHYTPRLPLSKRDMAERWRRLRRFQREGLSEELDIDGTILDICHFGVFRGPILQPPMSNQSVLLLLIDQRGSMTPFTLFIEALLESLAMGELKDKHHVYYFHNCPSQFLYEESSLMTPRSLEQIFVRYATRSRVLIVSDAGAARASYNETRIKETKVFLKLLRDYTYLYAWLNPMPVYRWQQTTAEEIAQQIPMFPLSRDGLEDAISVLQGRLVSREERSYA